MTSYNNTHNNRKNNTESPLRRQTSKSPESLSVFLTNEKNELLPVSYTLLRSQRRTWALSLSQDGTLTLRVPLWMSTAEAERILLSKTDWILDKQEQLARRRASRPVSRLTPEEKRAQELRLRREAADLIPRRAAYYQAMLPGQYRRIYIRGQKTRWGSCSSAGNLSFNWKLMLAPPEILDYVVVHELCHLTQMNHSRAFWALVESILPDYKQRRKWLRDNGTSLEL
ncbi:MAG: SprT family zinc-dependent metalloprotease [Eubacteriales bacterium]|nr:SprT family zinc-dependent metalloprotease [Eubacteriales bacterium]